MIRSYLRLVGKHPEASRSLWGRKGVGLCHHLLTCPLDPQGLWSNPSSMVWNRRNKYLLLLHSSFSWMLNPWSLDLREYDVEKETEWIRLREGKEIILVWRAPGWKVRTLPSSIKTLFSSTLHLFYWLLKICLLSSYMSSPAKEGKLHTSLCCPLA